MAERPTGNNKESNSGLWNLFSILISPLLGASVINLRGFQHGDVTLRKYAAKGSEYDAGARRIKLADGASASTGIKFTKSDGTEIELQLILNDMVVGTDGEARLRVRIANEAEVKKNSIGAVGEILYDESVSEGSMTFPINKGKGVGIETFTAKHNSY